MADRMLGGAPALALLTMYAWDRAACGGRCPQCSHVDLMAFSVIVLITIVCALGTKQSSRTNLVLVRWAHTQTHKQLHKQANRHTLISWCSARTLASQMALTLTIIIFVIVTGSIYVQPSNWSDFIPYGFGGTCEHPLTLHTCTGASG